MKLWWVPLSLCALLGACNQETRLAEVGGLPRLTHIQDPTGVPTYRPVTMPMPTPIPERLQANSLWQAGARTFFKDQRASRIGDLLTIIVALDDKAEVENTSTRSRDSEDSAGVNNFFGLEGNMKNFMPKAFNPAAMVGLKSNPTHKGTGTVNRKEKINLKVAAVVTQVLPNGNLVISGRQEMRINYEIRELQVAGVIRREDILSDNTISSDKIAEARISYGGRGMIDDMQQPPYGQQVVDMIMPF